MALPIIRYRGSDGQLYDIPAIRGADGVSPTVEIEQVPDGVQITITDAQGAHTFLIQNPTVPASVTNHIVRTDNPHGVTAGQIGLGNVDDTSDAEKPISTAQQAALDGKANNSHDHDERYYTETEIDTKLLSKMEKDVITVSSAAPSGGNNGDIWIQYE